MSDESENSLVEMAMKMYGQKIVADTLKELVAALTPESKAEITKEIQAQVKARIQATLKNDGYELRELLRPVINEILKPLVEQWFTLDFDTFKASAQAAATREMKSAVDEIARNHVQQVLSNWRAKQW